MSNCKTAIELRLAKIRVKELEAALLYLDECAVESGNELDYEIEKSVFEEAVALIK